MGIGGAELGIIVVTLFGLAFFAMPFVGIPRALKRAKHGKRSMRSVVLSSVGVSFGLLGLVSGAMGAVGALLLLALDGSWLAAALWSNKQVRPNASAERAV